MELQRFGHDWGLSGTHIELGIQPQLCSNELFPLLCHHSIFAHYDIQQGRVISLVISKWLWDVHRDGLSQNSPGVLLLTSSGYLCLAPHAAFCYKVIENFCFLVSTSPKRLGTLKSQMILYSWLCQCFPTQRQLQGRGLRLLVNLMPKGLIIEGNNKNMMRKDLKLMYCNCTQTAVQDCIYWTNKTLFTYLICINNVS